MYDTIVNMYSNIKSRIFYGSVFSEYFPCNVGVRQGESLSPLLFSLYINDLEHFLKEQDVEGLKTVSDDIEIELDYYLKLFLILYADDTALLAESKNDLQKQLDSLYNYCELWKLKVNVNKSKIVVFSKGRPLSNIEFKYNNTVLEIVNEFTYLGVIFSRTGSFSKAKKAQTEKATHAMYDVIRKGRKHNLSIECQLDLFDKIVKPILLYGSEVWGVGNNSVIERVHLKFCKILLNVKKSTPDFMIYGELGRYPLEIDIKLRILNYWSKLMCGKQEKLPVILYKYAYKKYGMNIPWLNNIKSILDSCGLSYVWNAQYFVSNTWLYHKVKVSVVDQFKQNWHSILLESPKAINYRLFKDNAERENYFKILDDKNIITFCRFRILSHKLPIETGRWKNVPRENRNCKLCNSGDIGDEFHYIFKCSKFNHDREKNLKPYYLNRPNILKFHDLMNTRNISMLNHLCKFIRLINKQLDS